MAPQEDEIQVSPQASWILWARVCYSRPSTYRASSHSYHDVAPDCHLTANMAHNVTADANALTLVLELYRAPSCLLVATLSS